MKLAVTSLPEAPQETTPIEENIPKSILDYIDSLSREARKDGRDDARIALNNLHFDLEYGSDRESAIKRLKQLKPGILTDGQMQTLLDGLNAGRNIDAAEETDDSTHDSADIVDTFDADQVVAPHEPGEKYEPQTDLQNDPQHDPLNMEEPVVPKKKYIFEAFADADDFEQLSDAVREQYSPDIFGVPLDGVLAKIDKFKHHPTEENLRYVPDVAGLREKVSTLSEVGRASAPGETIDAAVAEKERREKIDEDLSSARDRYATALTEWKAKRPKFYAMMRDLGVYDKDLPVTPELAIAKKEYLAAKAAKSKELLGKMEVKKNDPEQIVSDLPFSVGGESDATYFEVKETEEKYSLLLDNAEKEYKKLQDKIDTLLPPEKQGRMKEALACWAKKPLLVRISAVPILLGAIMFFAPAGGVALGTAGAATGIRIARGLAGTITSRLAGTSADAIFNIRNESREKAALKAYGAEATDSNLEEKEARLMEHYDKAEFQKKRQQLYKGAAMVAVGGAVGYAAGLEAESLRASMAEADRTLADAAYKDLGSRSMGVSRAEALFQKPPVVFNSSPVNVELSQRGFIDTLDDLKEKLREQYGTDEHVPKGVKELIDTDSTKLAIKFGFYDPEHHRSGMGMKGDSLVVDEKGNLLYKNADQSSNVISDAEHGEIGRFSGKMHDFGTSKPAEDVMEYDYYAKDAHAKEYDIGEGGGSEGSTGLNEDGTESTFNNDVPPKNEDGIEESYENDGEDGVSHTSDIPASRMDITNNNGSLVMRFAGEEIAHEHQVGNTKVLALDDKFQDGQKFEPVRSVFIEEFEKNLVPGQLGKTVIPVPFEGGKIHIAQGLEGQSNGVRVFMNGKEIAQGVVDEKGAHVKLLNTRGIKSGWFFSDTVYERALKLKSIKNILKNLRP